MRKKRKAQAKVVASGHKGTNKYCTKIKTKTGIKKKCVDRSKMF